jgi:hypothetical protein
MGKSGRSTKFGCAPYTKRTIKEYIEKCSRKVRKAD